MIIELRETISSNKLFEIEVQSAKSPYIKSLNQIYNPDTSASASASVQCRAFYSVMHRERDLGGF